MARTHNATRASVARLHREGWSASRIADELGLARSTIAYHLRQLDVPADERFRRRYDWEAVQAYYDEGHSGRECIRHFGFSAETWHAAKRRGDIVTRPRVMSVEELVLGPRNRTHLRDRLMREGLLPAHCQVCGLTSWLGRPISLQLHHLNGIGDDNRLENLQILCPNCHSQTENWGGRNKRRLRAAAAPVDVAEADAA